ncbi:MAG: FecR family protein [Dysgonamonadaceae bacterium]
MNCNDFLNNDLFVLWMISPTKELDAYWKRYLQTDEASVEAFYEAVEEFNNIRSLKDNSYNNEEKIVKHRLNENITNYKKKQKTKLTIISSVAAVLLLIISLPLITNKYNGNISKEEVLIGSNADNNGVQLLSGNEVLSLSDNSILDLSEKDNNVVIHDSTSKKEVRLKDIKTNKLIVPYGKRSSIVLADGSTIYMNSGSELTFPSSFSGNTREVTAVGEIYIEVAKQKEPFIIHTPQSKIRVYGTTFNVSAYAEEKEESVVLVNGSVEIESHNQSLILKPNERAVVKDGEISSRTVDTSEYVSWKNGFFKLYNTPLNDVLMKIGRYYNVEFMYSKELKLDVKTCSGKLFLAENINDVLSSFSLMTNLMYQLEANNRITISK